MGKDMKLDAALLTAALSVMGRAFEMVSAVIATPLHAMASIYWRAAIAKSGIEPRDIVEVDPNTLVASSTGILYWIPPNAKQALEAIGNVGGTEEQDAWLAANCVKMARVTVDQLVVPMEHTFWQNGAESPMMQQLNGQLEAAFESVLSVIIGGKPAPDMIMLAVVPTVAFTESRDNPFTGLITISSRCGFYKVPTPQVG